MPQRLIGVVGAGPAGIMAALEAARLGATVTLFDTNATVGRKLLITGNGRCNISNLRAEATKYVCAEPHFMQALQKLCTPQMLLERLRQLCIPTWAMPDGWCYPLSNSAATVVDALAAALELAGVELRLQTKIADLNVKRGQWALQVGGPSEIAVFDRVVVATGGKAYPALGSKGELFPALARLGHTIVPILPALAPLKGDVRRLHKLQGVRLDVVAKLYQGEQVLASSTGNVMFSKDGLSGPAAMDLSYLAPQRKGLTLAIDLIHEHRPVLDALIAQYRHCPLPVSVLLGAVLPVKLPPVLLGLVGLAEDVTLDALPDTALASLLDIAQSLRVPVTGTRGLQQAQLSSGGVPVNEVEAPSMASRRVPGLYLAGEVLDVIGPCGGYNLHFAFSSGMLAGRAAAS